MLRPGDAVGVDLAGATKPDLTPKLLTTADGKPVLNYKGEPIYYPAAYPPEFFKNAGEQDAIGKAAATGDEPSYLANRYIPLMKFFHGESWDMQRLTGVIDLKYIDYSTVAIGIYSKAAGYSSDEILNLQNIYSKYLSNYGNDSFEATYTYLPKRNVYNNN